MFSHAIYFAYWGQANELASEELFCLEKAVTIKFRLFTSHCILKFSQNVQYCKLWIYWCNIMHGQPCNKLFTSHRAMSTKTATKDTQKELCDMFSLCPSTLVQCTVYSLLSHNLIIFLPPPPPHSKPTWEGLSFLVSMSGAVTVRVYSSRGKLDLSQLNKNIKIIR